MKLGMVLDNVRKRAGKLTGQRRADPDALGMRWGRDRIQREPAVESGWEYARAPALAGPGPSSGSSTRRSRRW